MTTVYQILYSIVILGQRCWGRLALEDFGSISMSETKAKVVGKQNGVSEKEKLASVMFCIFLYLPIEYSLA